MDIRVTPCEGFDPQGFRAIELEGFPIREDQREITHTVMVKQAAFTLKEELRGVFFRSENRIELAQFRIDGFTFNRLKPYSSWDEIWPSAFRLWKIYESTAKPVAVTRLAVRYINRIELPKKLVFEDVLSCFPPTPRGLTVVLTKYSSRVSFDSEHDGMKAHVSTKIDGKPDQEKGDLLLDIDAYYRSPTLQTADDLDEKITQEFEALHNFKNDIFFATLTEKQIKEFE